MGGDQIAKGPMKTETGAVYYSAADIMGVSGIEDIG
jgi:hypothetical protein